MIRLQKLLAQWGVCSRRKAEEFIEKGEVSVNGQIAQLGCSIDENSEFEIKLSGKVIKKPKNEANSVFLLHKPKYVVTTMKDEKGRRCVADFLPKNIRLYPVGRLDYDSSGLLLVTNFGELTNRLLHPSYGIKKEYIAVIKGSRLSQEEENEFKKGILLEDGYTAPCQINRINQSGAVYSVTIREGRNRQVRRMFDYFGRKVLELKRIGFGPIRLGDQKPGSLRPLTQNEYKALLNSVRLNK